MKKRDNTIEIRIRVAIETKNEFQNVCFLNGKKTMTSVIEELIKGFIQEKSKINKNNS